MKIQDSWQKFVSTANLYIRDSFVKSIFVPVNDASDASQLRGEYITQVEGSVLPEILVRMNRKLPALDKLTVLDCGVYMDHFAVAARGVCNYSTE